MSNSDETRRFFSYVFIGALALLFALEWGPGARGCNNAGTIKEQDNVATVNGEPIPLKDFAREYVQQAETFRRQGVPSEMLKQFGIHKQVLDRMVNTELLAQAAEKRGLSASDDDLARLYGESELFKKDGKFDHDTFQEWVRNVEGTTEVKFEDKLRRQLAAQRMLQLVESSAVVSDDEVRAKYAKDGNAAKISFVRFTPTMFAEKAGTPKPAELDAWVKANGAAIADFYEKNKFTYFVPEKVKARQILLKVAPDATVQQKLDVKVRAENLRKELADNKKPFADVATQFSEDLESKPKGGSIGLVERLSLAPAFADVLFALKPGEISTVVETQLGYFIGTIEEKKASEQKPLDAVKGEIAAQLYVKEKAKGLAKAEADKALADVKKGKTLAELYPAEDKADQTGFNFAQERKPATKETAEFSSTAETIPSLGASPEAMKAIFARTDAGLVDQLITVGDALVIVTVTERKAPSDEGFEKEKADLRLQALKGKQFEVREAFLKALKQSGTVVTNDKAVEKVVGTDS
jgi:peptidyl-prolyl cis-trans isomerase D